MFGAIVMIDSEVIVSEMASWGNFGSWHLESTSSNSDQNGMLRCTAMLGHRK